MEVNKMGYRLLVKRGRKWQNGLVEYPNQEVADARAVEMRAVGHTVKVVPNSYFGISKQEVS